MTDINREKDLNSGDFHVDDEHIRDINKTMLDHWQIIYAHIKAAVDSDNPTIIDALNAVCVLVRLTEAESLERNLELERMFSGKDLITRVDRETAHKLVDEVLNSRDGNGMFALGNFMDVAGRRKKK